MDLLHTVKIYNSRTVSGSAAGHIDSFENEITRYKKWCSEHNIISDFKFKIIQCKGRDRHKLELYGLFTNKEDGLLFQLKWCK